MFYTKIISPSVLFRPMWQLALGTPAASWITCLLLGWRIYLFQNSGYGDFHYSRLICSYLSFLYPYYSAFVRHCYTFIAPIGALFLSNNNVIKKSSILNNLMFVLSWAILLWLLNKIWGECTFSPLSCHSLRLIKVVSKLMVWFTRDSILSTLLIHTYNTYRV